MKIGLVLEGGGMRSLYTIGALDLFWERGLRFPYLIGVSAGACAAVSYVSEQPGRSLRVNTQYVSDSRYLSVENYFRTGSLFGMDFIFDEIPHKLDPFDYDTFLKSPARCVTGVTDAWTGKAVYFDKEALDHDTTVLRASCSLPVFSRPVSYQGRLYVDGGTVDPIPFRHALEDGCDRLITILTRPRDYRKKPESMEAVYKQVLKNFPALVTALERRHLVYTVEQQKLAQLEAQEKAIVLAPESLLSVDRFEKDPLELRKVYEQGRADAARLLERESVRLEQWGLHSPDKKPN